MQSPKRGLVLAPGLSVAVYLVIVVLSAGRRDSLAPNELFDRHSVPNVPALVGVGRAARGPR